MLFLNSKSIWIWTRDWDLSNITIFVTKDYHIGFNCELWAEFLPWAQFVYVQQKFERNLMMARVESHAEALLCSGDFQLSIMNILHSGAPG